MPLFRALPEPLWPVAKTENTDTNDQPTPVPVAEALVDCGVYVDGRRLPGNYTYATALAKVRELQQTEPPEPREGSAHTHGQTFVWIGLHEPDQQQMQAVADVLDLHPLAVEDAVQAHQRPKLERYDQTLFLVLKTVNYVPHESVVLAREIVETGELMVFVGKDFVVTVRHGEHGGLADVRRRMDADPQHLRLGPVAMMHAIADDVVDHYLEVTHLVEADIDSIEEVAFSPNRKIDVEPIYLLKREVVELRRCVSPLSLPLARLQTEHKDLISKEVRRYLRDVADHHAEAADQITSYDDMLTSLVQAALARVGMQQNNDMRKMAAIAGILAVPTMIAAIYGMNFSFMPELHWTWGYPLVLGGMGSISLFLYRTFRHNRWL